MKKVIINILYLTGILVIAALTGCSSRSSGGEAGKEKVMMENNRLDTATFGGGCFWCIEAAFSQLRGVENVSSGYSGGSVANPTYEEVCTGETGHAEVVRIIYDPELISYDKLLEVFWSVHDPTTLNRQGNDTGTQYRSVIFYHNENQKTAAEKQIKALNESGILNGPVVTELSPFEKFYKAENYHQDYYVNNSNKPYCSFTIKPKLEKIRKVFGELLKK